MRKILTLLFMVAAWLSFAQTGNVGVNTTTPDAVLEVYSTTKGVLVPRLTTAQRDAMVSPLNPANKVQEGTIIYNLDQHCLQYNVAPTGTTPNWVGYGCDGVVVTPGSITTLNCAGATTTGTLTSGTGASGVSSSVPYTGGNGGSYAAQTVTSTGVTGLTANLAAGSFATGAGNLTYTIMGTPTSSGTASFALSIGGQSCTLNVTVAAAAGSITTLNCAGATTTGTLTSGTGASGVSSSVPYTGGNGGSYAAQTVTSTGVTGLTATLAAGNFASGNGSLTYTITGTPSAVGTASFAINIGGQSCTFTRTVAAITIPATITLAQNRSYIVASVYDQDYLPYTAPTGPATTTTPVAAGGGNEAVTVNVQGTITTAGVAVKIPVTATGSGYLPAYSTTISIPASMTEDGIGRDLTLSWPAQAYTGSTTTINATIAAVGGTLNAKKLDINAGIGNDALGVLMGQFTYPYNNAGNTTTYSVRDIAGIPDRMFGLPDNNSNSTTHMMLYLPMVAADGNIWLNNNLGADYSNINKAAFNPASQAISATDFNAYGSLIQWGRKTDGHELITWTNSTTGTVVNGTTSTRPNADTAANALFITINTGNFDWRGTTHNDALWATEASANNPCPVGFRVPTNAELTTLVTSSSITNSATAASSAMKFTVPGFRNYDSGSLGGVGSFGYYWSSSVNGSYAIFRNVTSGGTNTSDLYRAHGFTVRCLKD